MLEQSRSTIAIWAVAVAVAVFAALRLLGGGGGAAAPPVRVDGGAGSGGSAQREPAASSSERLFVHVVGAVRRPGLIRVADGTRVGGALERAGGPTGRADLTLVNLAARVQDGQQIVVPMAGAGAGPGAAAGPAAAGSAAGSPGGGASGAPRGARLHLSTATAEELDQVEGIGPTLAARIVEYRDTHGGLRSLDELAQVDGIGEQRLATLRDALQP
jgi:competence protein ComEA